MLYTWRVISVDTMGWGRRNEESEENGERIFGRTQKFHQSPRARSWSRDIRRALSWRYASCGRRGMLILCGAFITRGQACFTFMKFSVRLILLTKGKKGKLFPNVGRSSGRASANNSAAEISVVANR